MSAYELARLANIDRNNAELKRLGLMPSIFPNKTNEATKKGYKETQNFANDCESEPQKVFSLGEKPVVKYTGMALADQGGEDFSDQSSSESGDDSEADSEHSTAMVPKKIVRQPSTSTKKKSSLLTIEDAKTGRSSCLCREGIEKGSPRVGMLSWIVGRNAMTWQHPSCFLSQIKVGVASNSKARCKAGWAQC